MGLPLILLDQAFLFYGFCIDCDFDFYEFGIDSDVFCIDFDGFGIEFDGFVMAIDSD